MELLKKLQLGFLGSLRRADGFVALDIGSTSIKMVETAVEKNGYRLLKIGLLPLPVAAVQNNLVVETKAVSEGIRRLIQAHGVKSTKVISAVPGRAVIMKKIQMPMQEESELEANIEFEANNVIPERVENLNLDFQVLNVLEGGTKMDVLLVGVKKEIVNSYSEAILEAGLEPAVMDVDYFAMENMYEANYAAESVTGLLGLINIGARYTSITLLQNGLSTFTGDLSIGGEDFTDAIRRSLGIAPEAAERLKITGMLDGKKGPALDGILSPISENLAEEIRRTVTLYGTVGAEESEGLKVVYLSGGSARIPGLREIMEQNVGVPVRLAEPFRAFSMGREVDRDLLAESAPLFAVAAGLSIRRPGDK
ncbi:MAG TPA: type IV pilus assembly protein PilM [candidate division Zixibacteria bacterium]|nr:type IV pilus assembly protein PilM [candidate division Zixibacteria bacterium]